MKFIDGQQVYTTATPNGRRNHDDPLLDCEEPYIAYAYTRPGGTVAGRRHFLYLAEQPRLHTDDLEYEYFYMRECREDEDFGPPLFPEFRSALAHYMLGLTARREAINTELRILDQKLNEAIRSLI